MKILFSAYNATTKIYLIFLKNSNDVCVFQNFKSTLNKPHGVDVLEVNHALELLRPFLRPFKLDRVFPEYILNLKRKIKVINPSILVVVDFYNFTFYQFLKFKKINPDSKLYLWSETRNWPKFWLSRWLMYGFWWYFKRNMRYVEKVFVFTEAGKIFFNTYAPEINVEVFSAPIDSNVFFSDKNKLYTVNDELHIIMNARYIALKEHRTLFKAAKILKDKKNDFTISLIGRGGHLETELKEYAKKLGIDDTITWLEPVQLTELQAIYNDHDVLVLPSNREAIGMVVPEAMACGLATITSDAVGANTYVEERETGLVFEAGNESQLVDCLEQLKKSGVAAHMGKQAAAVIQKKYTINVLGQKFARALE